MDVMVTFVPQLLIPSESAPGTYFIAACLNSL